MRKVGMGTSPKKTAVEQVEALTKEVIDLKAENESLKAEKKSPRTKEG